MDEQRVGPYKLWLHTHRLVQVEGTKMTDEIVTKYPLVFSIQLLIFFVRRTLERIFRYRREKLDEIFQSPNFYPAFKIFALAVQMISSFFKPLYVPKLGRLGDVTLPAGCCFNSGHFAG